MAPSSQELEPPANPVRFSPKQWQALWASSLAFLAAVAALTASVVLTTHQGRNEKQLREEKERRLKYSLIVTLHTDLLSFSSTIGHKKQMCETMSKTPMSIVHQTLDALRFELPESFRLNWTESWLLDRDDLTSLLKIRETHVFFQNYILTARELCMASANVRSKFKEEKLVEVAEDMDKCFEIILKAKFNLAQKLEKALATFDDR